MADNPFDRTVINVRERPLSVDVNQAQSQLDRTLRFLVQEIFRPRASLSDERPGSPVTGFIGNGFAVREDSPAGLSVVVGAGIGFFDVASDAPSAIGGVAGVDDLNRYKPMALLSDATIAVPAPDPTNPRIDIVEATINRRLENPTSRDVLNAVTGVFEPQTVNKTLAWNVGSSIDNTTITPTASTAALSYKQGIPNATPTPPSVSPGYVKVAEILVGNGVASIVQNVVQDSRRILAPEHVREVSLQGTLTAGAPTLDALQAPPGVRVSVTDDGASGFVYVVAGDLTGVVPVAWSQRQNGTPNAPVSQVVSVTPAIQTLLANAAQADPTLQVAQGQQVLQIDIGTITDIYHVNARF